MRPHDPRHLVLCLTLAALSVSSGFGQIPSARLQVSESSGFLGIGSPRFVNVSLSTSARDTALTSDAVNGSNLFFFLLKPADGWLPDDEFFAADAPTLRIRQGERILPLESTSPFSSVDSTVLLGYSKTLRLDVPFEFMIGLEDEIFTAPFEVPSELWPDFPRLEMLIARARTEHAAGDYRAAVASIDSALLDPSLSTFPQLAGLRDLRTATMVDLANSASARLDSVVAESPAPLEDKVAEAGHSADALRFAADSLQAPSLGVVFSDPSMVSLALRMRSQAARAVIVRDSLQQQFDLARVGWILEKGNHTKNGLLYAKMIQALAYGFSSIDFLDTTASTFNTVLPQQLERSLAQEGILSDYEIFVRMCNDRYLHGVPLFPVDFLPTLRKDTAQYAMPVYYILQGVGDYWTGDLENARAAAFAVLRRASDSLIISRYDMMRIAVEFRLRESPPTGMDVLVQARQRLSIGDTLGATALLDTSAFAPRLAPLALLRGDLALARQDTVGALGQYASAWLSDRRAIDAYLRSSLLLRARGEFQRADEILKLALDAGNEYWIVFYRLGITSMEKGDATAARDAYHSALLINPRSYETAIGLGQAYQASGDFRRAREYYNRAITIDPLRTEAVERLTILNKMYRPPR